MRLFQSKLFVVGVGGSLITLICCFTPLLPVILTSLGLKGLVGLLYQDAVLFPILAGFLALAGFAVWLQKSRK